MTNVLPDPHRDALQLQCDRFNAEYPVGTTCAVVRDNGEAVVSETLSVAQVLSGHSAVIWVHGISGCYLLDRVHPFPAEAA
ncbi:hypothetical protein [Novosphingobium guangzhouense]|uniref:Uncharacterized protein n=1 Tax=Novosphingobium guangzhouense TaxID=1850347 RepID=A0A2K2G466_9SPHN|nr:hypothetical protein [Novosphingobium guangzhouense]PNU05826.1 hypothetical protein A8V01_14775 [Novosphingobium guangzhouense]